MNNLVLPAYIWRPDVYSASYKVEFPNLKSLDFLIMSAELKQSIEEHDLLILRIKGKPNRKETQIAYGDPVKFTYRSGKIKSVFVGKVDRVYQTGGIDGVNQTIIKCISASACLKDSTQEIHTNVTADQVVSKICQRFGLSSTVQRDPRVRKAIVQSGQTYWQLFRSLAKQTGFALRAENTTVTFCSKDKITASKKSQAPYFYYVDSPVNGAINALERALGSILYFKPVISDASPEAGVKVDRVISGKSQNGRQTIKTVHPHVNKKTPQKGAVKPSEDYFL
jgi:hypothetical protein